MENLYELLPDFNFDVDEDLFHDAPQDAETLTVIGLYFRIIFTVHFKFIYCSFIRIFLLMFDILWFFPM